MSSFDLTSQTQAIQSQLSLIQEEFRTLCTRPDHFKDIAPHAAMVDSGASRILTRAFDDLCGCGILTQNMELIEKEAKAPSQQSRILESRETLLLVAQFMLADLHARIERRYSGWPSLYREGYALFESTSDLYDHYELSGLFLGLIRSPLHATTIIPPIMKT